MTTPNHNKQSGHAALLFVLLFPFLFGIFALGTDGARALQDKARLEEASEIAALTVAAQNSDSKNERDATAKKIIQEYFPESNITDVNVDKLACENNNNCNQNNSDQQRFFEYRVSVTLSEDSWFYSEDTSIASMGESYNVSGYSTARKYQSEAVDVVLVADYSASMYKNWTGGSKKKFEDLNDIIVEIAEELAKFNKLNTDEKINKLAIVGFDYYTSKQVEFTYSCGRKGRYTCTSTERFFAHHLSCYPYNCSTTRPGTSNFYNNSNYSVNVNATRTIANIFNPETNWFNEPIINVSEFNTIALKDPLNDGADFTKGEIDNNFYIPRDDGSGTASYTGIIRGAKISKTGSNPRRLIIILSDGVDSFPKVSDALINAGLCETIRNKLNEDIIVDGKIVSVKARLAAVGFDYNIQNNPQMKNCVGADNVYKAENTNDIKNKILELISEEIGHLTL